jgi:hypothetical protein
VRKVYKNKTQNKQNSLTHEECLNNRGCLTKAATTQLMFNKRSGTHTSISKRELSIESNNHIKNNETNTYVEQTNKARPHSEISIEFAAKQFFQILLMDIKSRHAINNEIEPVVSAISN